MIESTAEELLDRANFYAYTLKNFDRAIDLYHKYARLYPDDYVLYIYLFHAYWFKKEYQKAWQVFESRFSFYKCSKDTSEMAKFELKHCILPRRWDGKQDISGQKVLVWGEEGIGDILHFLRYIPHLKALGGHIIFTARYPVLRTLLEKQSYIDQVVIQESDSPIPEYDICLPIMSIPFLTGINDFPPPPYLTVEGKINLKKDKKNIGICWAGNSLHNNDAARSRQLQEFLPLATNYNQLVSLQKEKRLDDKKDIMNLLEPELNTLEDTAKVINGCDIVVSVDTSVAHLAGAMNKETYLLLASYPEWRWGLDETNSIWYPNTRLCKSVGELVSLVNQNENRHNRLVQSR